MVGVAVKRNRLFARLRTAWINPPAFWPRGTALDPLSSTAMTAADLIAMARAARKAEAQREEQADLAR